MSAAAQTPVQQFSRRRFLRHASDIPVDITVLRSGVPQTIPARIVDLCEGGLSAILAGELQSGQAVGVEFSLPHPSEFVRAKAVVRHQAEMSCGLEFLALASNQQENIQLWLHHTTGQALPNAIVQPASENAELRLEMVPSAFVPKSRKTTTIRIPAATRTVSLVGLASIVLLLALAAIGWWQWQGAWKTLEPSNLVPAEQRGAVGVAPEVMQSLLIHKVDPIYPESAREAGIQGTVVMRVIVGKDGSVVRVDPVSGPDTLVEAAAAAVKWWRFQPYETNGKAVPVQTTVSVLFQP